MTQESFSRLWEGYGSDKAALRARNAKLRELRKQGKRCRGWVLRDQLKPYDGFGQPNGGVCNVYFINIGE